MWQISSFVFLALKVFNAGNSLLCICRINALVTFVENHNENDERLKSKKWISHSLIYRQSCTGYCWDVNRTCPSVIKETLEIMTTVPLQYIYYLENLGLESWWNQWFGFMLRILTGHRFICNFKIILFLKINYVLSKFMYF